MPSHMASQGSSSCRSTRVARWKQELASLKQAALRKMNATTTSRNPRRCLRIGLICLLDLKDRGKSAILEMKTGNVRDQQKKAVKIRAPLPIIFCAASLMQLQLFQISIKFQPKYKVACFAGVGVLVLQGAFRIRALFLKLH